jgi:aspartokinase
MGTEYVSRSQARRIITRLDKFKTIILDFKDVETVGQGFADEIFRVWKSRNHQIEIIPVNQNENIDFMIKRAVIKEL